MRTARVPHRDARRRPHKPLFRSGPCCGIGPQRASGTRAPIGSVWIDRRTPGLSPGRVDASNADLVLGFGVVQHGDRVAVGDADDGAFEDPLRPRTCAAETTAARLTSHNRGAACLTFSATGAVTTTVAISITGSDFTSIKHHRYFISERTRSRARVLEWLESTSHTCPRSTGHPGQQ